MLVNNCLYCRCFVHWNKYGCLFKPSYQYIGSCFKEIKWSYSKTIEINSFFMLYLLRKWTIIALHVYCSSRQSLNLYHSLMSVICLYMNSLSKLLVFTIRRYLQQPTVRAIFSKPCFINIYSQKIFNCGFLILSKNVLFVTQLIFFKT